jgi:outer membrane protein assembly factor BamB
MEPAAGMVPAPQSPPAIIGDRAYIVSKSRTIAVNADTGAMLWTAPAGTQGGNTVIALGVP